MYRTKPKPHISVSKSTTKFVNFLLDFRSDRRKKLGHYTQRVHLQFERSNGTWWKLYFGRRYGRDAEKSLHVKWVKAAFPEMPEPNPADEPPKPKPKPHPTISKGDLVVFARCSRSFSGDLERVVHAEEGRIVCSGHYVGHRLEYIQRPNGLWKLGKNRPLSLFRLREVF